MPSLVKLVLLLHRAVSKGWTEEVRREISGGACKAWAWAVVVTKHKVAGPITAIDPPATLPATRIMRYV